MGNALSQFKKKVGLLTMPRFDEIVVKDNEARALMTYVKKHLKRRSPTKRLISENEASKQMSEIFNIMKGIPITPRINNISKRSLSIAGAQN